ncbi:MinD/ParA family protein [Kocuria sp. M1R5S2]|uniref:MinD/ParA family ATP-binding protein n=1 Tax=Kocuria rhizosphaerae TaxID=3376285 RepID=UPI0037AB77DD
MAQALDRPRCTATITDDDTVEVSIDGVLTPLNSMDEAIAHLTDTARALRRPVKVVALDPSSHNDPETHLIVGPDGNISADGTAAPASRGGPRGGRAVSLEDLVPTEPVAEPLLIEPQNVPEPAPLGEAAPALSASTAPATTLEDKPVLDLDSAPSFIAAGSSPAAVPATQGWRGVLNRMGLHLGPGPAEVAEREETAAVSRHWVGSRTIAVVNQKGGANKTPTVALLAAQFAVHGGSGVLAWDNNEAMGSLGWRTETAGHHATALDLLTHAGHFLTAEAKAAELAAFVHHQPRDGYDVLRSDESPSNTHEITGAEVEALHRVAEKYYRLVIMDSGNSTRGENWAHMIAHTDQIVIATTTESDKAQGGVNALKALHAGGEHAAELARNAVVVISELLPSHSTKAQAIAEKFAPFVREVAIVPFDPHLVQGRIHHRQLRPATRRAWLHAAARVSQGF